MSELKWLYVLKVDDTIQFKASLESDYLQTQYGILTICIVKDYDDKICSNCKICELKNIKEGELWMFFNDEYFCNLCFSKVRPHMELFNDERQNLNKKIPALLRDVMKDIEKHHQYDKLDIIIKSQYEECVKQRNPNNNKYIRSLWFHLYHFEEMPIG